MNVILIVGPSGAGKDSLLRYAKESFQEMDSVFFAKRYITRPPDNSEDNYFVDKTCFSLLREMGFFISTWDAHTFHYGIPAHQLEDKNSYSTIIASVSRSAVADFERFHPTTTICVTASEEMLFERLSGRGRENEEQILNRIAQAQKPVRAENLITFDNSEKLEHTSKRFTALLTELSHSPEKGVISCPN